MFSIMFYILSIKFRMFSVMFSHCSVMGWCAWYGDNSFLSIIIFLSALRLGEFVTLCQVGLFSIETFQG